jgi:hypothetical protein
VPGSTRERPFKVFSRWVGLPKQRLPAWPSLVRLFPLQGVLRSGVATCMVCRSRFALSTLASRFPVFRPLPTRSGSTRMRPLVWFHSSSGFSPNHFSLRLSVPATLLGLSDRSAHPFRGVYSSQGSHSLGSVPRPGILTLFAVYSSLGLVGLFRPTNALRFHPSRVSPPGEGNQLIAGS